MSKRRLIIMAFGDHGRHANVIQPGFQVVATIDPDKQVLEW
jgi:hypothetical protein